MSDFAASTSRYFEIAYEWVPVALLIIAVVISVLMLCGGSAKRGASPFASWMPDGQPRVVRERRGWYFSLRFGRNGGKN